MQFPGPDRRPPVGIIFDSDMGNSIDDALALALLYGLEGKNEARLVSVSVSKSNLQAAAFCETVGRFYAGAVSGAFGGMGRTLPVGMADDGRMAEDTPMLKGVLARQTPEGKPVYNHGIQKLTDTAEVPALIRNAFTSQHDSNAIVVLTGPATNLARVLALPDAKGWISRKVRYLVLAAGAFPDGPPEFHVKSDIAAAKKLLAEWPTPVIVAGREIGDALLFPAASIEKDFAWSPAHPVADAYRAYQAMPYDAPTWAMTAALHAVRPQDSFFKLSEPGTIQVRDDGRTRFTPAPDGKHRHLILDPTQKERILKTYVEIASAKPVPRQPRFRPPDQKNVQKNDQKKQ